MKKLLPVLSFFLLIHFGCSKDEAKKDFVNDFTPALKETSGTSYTGDYYPFKVRNNWNWNGSETLKGKTTITGMDPQTTDKTESAYGYMTIVDSTRISLPSGHYDVLYTDETDGTARYFQVTDSAIILRAIKNYDMSQLAEVKNPVYIRRPLVVGDVWQTEPAVDYSKFSSFTSSGIGAIDITTKCKVFVLGNENITWKGAQTNTIALEERILVTGKVSIASEESGSTVTGTLNVNVTGDINLNLKEDVGIVQQDFVMDLTIKGSLTVYDGSKKQTANVNITMKVQSTMALSQYTIDGETSYKAAIIKDIRKKSPLAARNLKFGKQINDVVSLLDKIQKSIRPL
jgi:hypothetical protein